MNSTDSQDAKKQRKLAEAQSRAVKSWLKKDYCSCHGHYSEVTLSSLMAACPRPISSKSMGVLVRKCFPNVSVRDKKYKQPKGRTCIYSGICAKADAENVSCSAGEHSYSKQLTDFSSQQTAPTAASAPETVSVPFQHPTPEVDEHAEGSEEEWLPCEDDEWLPCEDDEWLPCEDDEWLPCEDDEWLPCEDDEWLPCENDEWLPCEDDEWLPCESQKENIKDKNSINQKPGIVKENMKWMFLEANRRGLSAAARAGVLVFSEMKIHEDLEMESEEPDTQLVGMVDYGTCQSIYLLRRHGGLHVLATHALQFMFLGYTGFKWPVGYYMTTKVHASELFVLAWEMVDKLLGYTFRVEGMIMDGSANNRKFIDLNHMTANKDSHLHYLITNPLDNEHTVSAMLDPSHCIRKIRNSLLASAWDSPNRKLRIGRRLCYWKHWEDAYLWDREANPLNIHHKLTDEHIFVTDKGKKRNHLAMDVLSERMLELMQEYQRETGREDLGFTLDIIRHVSKLVSLFTSNEAITSDTDQRLTDNMQVLHFFTEWKKSCKGRRSFITSECYENLKSTILGFDCFVKKRLKEHQGSQVIPSTINCDVVEEFFSSQRRRCHGCNTNPTALGYSKAINSIVMTTAVMKSNERNASSEEEAGGAHPFELLRERHLAASESVQV